MDDDDDLILEDDDDDLLVPGGGGWQFAPVTPKATTNGPKKLLFP